jgi:hypothetical protein
MNEAHPEAAAAVAAAAASPKRNKFMEKHMDKHVPPPRSPLPGKNSPGEDAREHRASPKKQTLPMLHTALNLFSDSLRLYGLIDLNPSLLYFFKFGSKLAVLVSLL